MITLKLSQLVNLANSGTLAKFFALKKPVAKYWGNRALPGKMDEELRAWDVARKSLIEQYGVEVKDGRPEFPKGNQAEFDNEVNELLAKDISFEATPVAVADITGDLTEGEMLALEPLIAS